MLNTPAPRDPLARTAEGIHPIDYVECIDWLSFPGYDAREGLITAAYPGTCNWVLEDESFGAWVQSAKGIFWIKGKPGSGKSTTMKHLLDLIRSEKVSGLSNVFPVYAATFFNARGSSLETSREGFLRSSIIQILQQKPELFKYIEEHYLRSMKQLSEPLLTKMLKILVRECSLTCRLGLLVDALDECDGPIREQIGLFEELIRISQEAGYLMCICVSGRPVHTLTAWLGHYPQLALEDHTSVDIATYVLAKTSRISSTTDAYMYKEFREDIMERSNGVFLWVVLVIEELLDAWEASESIAGLRTKLAAIPEDLDDFFARMLRKIPRSQFSETVAVFKCVLAALRPLTLRELRVALAFGSDDSFESIAEMRSSDKVVHVDDGLERRVQSCCGGLIEITKESFTVQVIHQTVLDYLLAPNRLQSVLADLPAFTRAQCHQYLLQACVKYLSVPELKKIPVHKENIFQKTEKPNYLPKFEFLSYSLLNWVDHYIGAEEGGESQAPKIKEFACPRKNHFFTWYRLYGQCFANGWDGAHPPFLSFAAEHNLLGYVEDYIKRNRVSSSDSGEFGGPVQAATISGNLKMVRLLLDHGVDVNAQGGRLGTAMAAAITFQDHGMIKLLHEHGANVELQAPGSPMLGAGRWAGHRNPFSRSRLESRALPVDHFPSRPVRRLTRYGNENGNPAPIFTPTIGTVHPISGADAKVVNLYQPAPDYAEMTDSADDSGSTYDEITMPDQDFQIYPSCEGDGASGGGLAAAAADDH